MFSICEVFGWVVQQKQKKEKKWGMFVHTYVLKYDKLLCVNPNTL